MPFGRALFLSLFFPALLSASDLREQPAISKSFLASRPPLQFERNAGQAGRDAAFLVHSGKTELQLDRRGAISWASGEGSWVSLTAVSANARPVIDPEEEQATRRNYYYPLQGKRQYTDVPSFGRVRYREIYPGIDLVYYGQDARLEYDYEVAPGASPDAIRLRISGSDAVAVENGELRIKTGSQELRFSKPIAYQVINGLRHSVEASFVVRSGYVTFRVGEYDRKKLLVIDPTILYSTFLNPPGQPSMTTGISADHTGNAYLLAKTGFTFGFTQLLTFSVSPGSCTVSKLNPDGTAILYQTTVAVNGDCGLIANDAAGNVFFSGHGTITPTAGVIQPLNKSTASQGNNFLIKLNASGQIAYATYLGGSGGEQFSSLAADGSGNLLITGITTSNDYPIQNAFQPTLLLSGPGDTANGFVSVVNPAGTALVFSTYFADASFSDIAADPAGNVYVVAQGTGPGFPLKNAASSTCPPGTTLCSGVAKFAPSGALVFSTLSSVTTFANGLQSESITADSAGTVYSVGVGSGPNPTPGGLAVVTTVDPANGNMQVLQSLPLSPQSGSFFRIGTDPANNVYIGPASQAPLLTDILVSTGEFQPVVSISPAGAINFQVDPPSNVIGFAVGSVGRAYVAGAPDFTPFFTVNPIQTAPVVGTGGLITVDVLDSYVASISASPGPSLGTSPAVLNFGDQSQGSPATKVVTLKNMGSDPLNISNVAATGDFTQTNDCTAPLAAASTCSVNVVLNPTALGSRTGTLSITSNATNSTQQISLSGNGLPAPAPSVTLSPNTLSFGDTPVGGNSPAQNITLTSNGTGAVNISRVDVSGDFVESNTCGTTVAVGGNCTISVMFHPTVAGARSGTVTITDNVAGSPQTITLNGNGGSGFVLQSTPAGTTPSATVNAGQSATYNLNVNSVLNFAGTVSLSCSGAPAGASCSVNPSSFQLNANSSVPVSISVSTTGRSTAALMHNGARFWTSIVAVLGLFLMCIRTESSRKRHSGFVMGLIASVLLGIAGCGGGGTTGPPVMSGTPAGTYTITISGTSGSVSQSMPVVLKVN